MSEHILELNGLLAAFPPGMPVVFATEDLGFRSWISSLGLEAIAIDELSVPDHRSPAVVLIPLDYSGLPAPSILARLLSGIRVLWIPLASFDSDYESACYSLSLLFASDLETAVEKNRRLISLLLTAREPLEFEGGGTAASVVLDDELRVSSRTRVVLAEGEQTGIGTYCEVALPTEMTDFAQAYEVGGVFCVEGILVSRHRQMPENNCGEFREARRVVEHLRARLPLLLHVEDNRLVESESLADVYETLRRVTNEKYDLLLTELAFGSNEGIRDRVDWRMNAQVNEGCGGIHLGVGDGLTGAHIDFVSPVGSLRGA